MDIRTNDGGRPPHQRPAQAATTPLSSAATPAPAPEQPADHPAGLPHPRLDGPPSGAADVMNGTTADGCTGLPADGSPGLMGPGSPERPTDAPAELPAPAGPAAGPALDALDVIEHQGAVLVRNFELLHRRTTIHDDLDRSAYLLLRVLARSGPLDINSLAGQLGLDPSTAGRQVSALLQRGLAERAPAAADRRRSIITPTEAGLRRMETVRLARAESLAALLAGWDTEELRTLGEAFTRYNASVARHFLTDGAPAAADPAPAGNGTPTPEAPAPAAADRAATASPEAPAPAVS